MSLKHRTNFISNYAYASLVAVVLTTILLVNQASARDLRYSEGEEGVIFITPGEPTQVVFPGQIEGGFKITNSSLALERQEDYLIIFAQPELPPEGEAIIVHLNDKRTYSIRAVPATDEHPRDSSITIVDQRIPETVEEEIQTSPKQSQGFAPPTAISGFMRHMILVAEFGKRKGIPGYRRSNRYSGETVFHDGALRAEIDEIYMGAELWGYVLSVENLLDTTQRLNPATFRLDGTRAVTAQRWELAPRPLTAEQKIANAHLAKVYIVTRAQR